MVGLFVAPVPARLLAQYDARILISAGMLWIGFCTLLRIYWTSSTDLFTLMLPQLLMGIGVPFAFMAANAMTLGSVGPKELASAAGLSNFTRTIALAVTTSLTMTFWSDQTRVAANELSGKLNYGETSATLTERGFSSEQVRILVAQLVDKEALTLATDKIFLIAGILTWAVAAWVWVAPRPKPRFDINSAAH